MTYTFDTDIQAGDIRVIHGEFRDAEKFNGRHIKIIQELSVEEWGKPGRHIVELIDTGEIPHMPFHRNFITQLVRRENYEVCD